MIDWEYVVINGQKIGAETDPPFWFGIIENIRENVEPFKISKCYSIVEL